MDGQMSIFDYLEEDISTEKEIGKRCVGCKYRVWLHRGGAAVQSCERYGSCHYEFDWERFSRYCSHLSGYIRFGDDEEISAGCTFKNEQPARSWDDWQKCTEENCPYVKGVIKE